MADEKPGVMSSLQMQQMRESLSNVGTIFTKELRSYFNSAVAYVVIVVFLAIVGWFHTSNLFLMNVASLRLMFEVVPAVFLFVVPAITMRLLAEEKKSGTIELLATKPLLDAEVVLGKFLAAWALIAIALAPTVLYYISIAFLGDVDLGPVIGGYIGLLLMAGVYVAVGLFASSLTENQIIAFIVGFVFVFILFMFDKVLLYVPDFLASVFEFLGIDYHFSSIARGVIDSRDLIYFASLLGFTFYLSVVSLERRKW
ncbi:MAG TPA: ABC transporter permease subunit [Bacteroidota bacterium]|nr:ABC transporter permease subunit [Bacteroidota bacterium]